MYGSLHSYRQHQTQACNQFQASAALTTRLCVRRLDGFQSTWACRRKHTSCRRVRGTPDLATSGHQLGVIFSVHNHPISKHTATLLITFFHMPPGRTSGVLKWSIPCICWRYIFIHQQMHHLSYNTTVKMFLQHVSASVCHLEWNLHCTA